jgi:membrane-bound lytic murein transglycosylase D
MELTRFLLVISIAVLLSACQTGAPRNAQAPDVSKPETPRHQVMYGGPELEVKSLPPVDLWDRIRRQLSWQEIHNSQVARARDHFLSQHDYLEVISERAALYLYYIVDEVERRDLPIEIALLPLVESTLNPFAYSSSRAAGLWQIMPATGRYLGLERDWWFDGRRDLRDSTRVALNYLESLHATFDGDWLLALAAYNSGKTRVRRAQQVNAGKGLGTDYWSLRLPRETRYYVPKLVALAQIIAYPEAFGVEIPTVANAPAHIGQLRRLGTSQLASSPRFSRAGWATTDGC